MYELHYLNKYVLISNVWYLPPKNKTKTKQNKDKLEAKMYALTVIFYDLDYWTVCENTSDLHFAGIIIT